MHTQLRMGMDIAADRDQLVEDGIDEGTNIRHGKALLSNEPGSYSQSAHNAGHQYGGDGHGDHAGHQHLGHDLGVDGGLLLGRRTGGLRDLVGDDDRSGKPNKQELPMATDICQL